jgi:hypothetical protein
MSLRDAVSSEGPVAEVVERYLGTQALPPETGKFQALNAAIGRPTP